MDITQSTAIHHIPFLLVDSGDHLTPIIGLSPSVLISKNCGAFAAPAGAVSGLSLGWYYIAANVTDSNTLGSLIVHASGAGADLYDYTHQIVAYNPNDAVSLGLSSVKSDIVKVSGSVLPVVQTAGYMPMDWANIGGKTANVSFTNTAVSGLNHVNNIADSILQRNVSNVEATAGEHTLCTVVLQSLESAIVGTTLTINRTDGTTPHATKVIGKTAGDSPIRSIS